MLMLMLIVAVVDVAAFDAVVAVVDVSVNVVVDVVFDVVDVAVDMVELQATYQKGKCQ